jgi:hypothetical protein
MSNAEWIEWQMYFARKAQRRELAERMARHHR